MVSVDGVSVDQLSTEQFSALFAKLAVSVVVCSQPNHDAWTAAMARG